MSKQTYGEDHKSHWEINLKGDREESPFWKL